MKLVIITQYQQSKKVRWANKGGDVYIVENIDFNQRQTIQRFGIPFLSSLLEYGMDVTDVQISQEFHSREYIKHYCLVEDDIDLVEAGLIDSWDNPWTLTYVKQRKQWTANRFVPAEDFWSNAPSGNPYEGKYEGFALAPAGERVKGSYKEHYVEKVAA